jgi:hypothetical protein
MLQFLFWEEAAGDALRRPARRGVLRSNLRKNLTINRLAGGPAWAIHGRERRFRGKLPDRAQIVTIATHKAAQMRMIASTKD